MDVPINLTPTVPALPKFEDKMKIDIRYTLIAPYASAHIYWDKDLGELVYALEEPLLSTEEKNILEKIEEAMVDVINVNVAVEKTLEATTAYIDKTARLLLEEFNINLSEDSYQRLFYYLFRDFIGLNAIEPLLRDYYIEDIECNGIDTPIYIIHRMYRNLRTNISFTDVDHLANFVEKLAQRTGRYISYAQPLLDGSLPDGSRVNASYTKDVTSKGPTFTIRKFTKVPWTPTQLIAYETVSP
ncbi:type II/IV secretion system ATPase subunit, partial [Candidatus Pacearchaeota archaeon]|nr:type II/IV secretion system ATPase subunit [Candidatus Pacearchaeota archaeon]